MVETMREARGIGLAGPQIGVQLRVIVVEIEEALYTLVNPEITWTSPDRDILEEGCLSIPGYRGNVERHTRIRVRAKDAKGKTILIDADDLLARVFQHEIDHLNGILFTERMAPGERLRPVYEDEEEDSKAPAPVSAARG